MTQKHHAERATNKCFLNLYSAWRNKNWSQYQPLFCKGKQKIKSVTTSIVSQYQPQIVCFLVRSQFVASYCESNCHFLVCLDWSLVRWLSHWVRGAYLYLSIVGCNRKNTEEIRISQRDDSFGTLAESHARATDKGIWPSVRPPYSMLLSHNPLYCSILPCAHHKRTTTHNLPKTTPL